MTNTRNHTTRTQVPKLCCSPHDACLAPSACLRHFLHDFLPNLSTLADRQAQISRSQRPPPTLEASISVYPHVCILARPLINGEEQVCGNLSTSMSLPSIPRPWPWVPTSHAEMHVVTSVEAYKHYVHTFSCVFLPLARSKPLVLYFSIFDNQTFATKSPR